MPPKLVFIVGALIASSATASRAGSISGTVVDEPGNGIANATVVVYKVRALLPPGTTGRRVLEPGVGKTVQTAAGGAFQIPNLPPGRYYICAAGPQRNQLNTCRWRHPDAPVSVSAFQPTTGVELKLRTGILITLQVQDPASRLAANTSQFLAGVISGSGEYARAQLVSSGANIFQYVVAVPRGSSVRLFVDSLLTVTDLSGRLIDKRRPGLLIPTTADVALSLTVN